MTSLRSATALMGTLTILLAACSSEEPLTAAPVEPVATILADTNRDGRVNDLDAEDKTDWSAEYGAIILANIGDTAGRCAGPDDESLSDDELEACHDASDDLPHAPDYFAPVRTLPVNGLSDEAFGTVAAVGVGYENIRIFIRREEGWEYFTRDMQLSAEELNTGLTFGVDSRDIIRSEDIWNGVATLEFTVTDGADVLTDRVTMRVAPVIIHNHLERANEVYVPQSDRPVHQEFVDDLAGALTEAGFTAPLARFDTIDNWAQDFVEFGYMSMPAPDGEAKIIRVAIRSPQPTRSAGRSLFALKGPGFGVVQTGGDNYHQADSFGNLETITPYELDGAAYPVGRVIYGDAGDGYAPHSDFTSFFDAQWVQDPVVLDTSWLIIAHVDEFVQFLPADNAYGWTIAIKDVPAAFEVLREAQAAGHGDAQVFSRPDAPQMTIDELLADEAFLEDNELARRRVELNLQILLSETGLPESQVVRIPGLFEYAGFSDFAPHPGVREEQPTRPSEDSMADADVTPREYITYSQGNMIAFYPAAVNGLLLDRENYIPPKQWGPVIDGVDIMEAAVTEAYAEAGITVWSIDDWLSHHSWGGEVHCGTNVTRDTTGLWWD